jgi:type VI secretion system protein ImpK
MSRLTLSPEALGAVQQFRAFYRELFAIKECIAAQRWNELSASPSPDSVSLPGGATARAIFARLYRAISGQGFGLRGPDRGSGAPIDVGYVMAAVADEVLLHGPAWPGQETWSETLLEEALYGSKVAGERIFRTAHELLTAQLSRSAVAVTVLLALMLGFRGRFHGTDDRGEIAALKERLFGVIFHLPYPVQVDFQTLLSEDAPRPLDQPSRRTLPSLRPWLMAILLLITGYIVLSDVLWRSAVSQILTISDNIIRTSAELTQRTSAGLTQ